MQADDIQSIAIVGAGLMGHGIAQEFALAGYDVCLQDTTEEKLRQALHQIQGNLQRMASIGLVDPDEIERTLVRIRPVTGIQEAAAGTDLIIEAVYEDLSLKQRIFYDLDRCCPERTILASNSSTLVPSLLASATCRPDRVLVSHYFNPPYLVPLVEIVRGPATSDAAVAAVYNLLRHIGKHPVIVEKEVPGFIANRLQAALAREALSIVQKGIASPQDVDIAIKDGFGRRLAVAGLFELFDLAGWDLILAASRSLLPDLDTSAEISPLAREKVERGELGVKTGKGFYGWTPESIEALQMRILQALSQLNRWP
ncbi:MAG: 3-hydroxyacyl-CoA dehydrogenase family protein [Armatimonadetes bacterium]|nr:3-hydroxyacyl-CoA dehydrogenase family protein [Armatimonadota bacterium]